MEFIQTNRVRHVDLNKFTIEELIKLPLSPGWVLISQKKNGIGEWRKRHRQRAYCNGSC